MTITVDATVSGTSSNSYLTVARSNVIAETFPHMNDWFTDVTINKAQLLVHATRLLDRYFVPELNSSGFLADRYLYHVVPPDSNKAVANQALWWPQKNFYYHNTTTAIPTNIIPEFVEQATVEWAWALHENPDPFSAVVPGLRTLDTPSYRMEFTGARQQVVPSVVSDLMGPYIRRDLKSFHRLIRV